MFDTEKFVTEIEGTNTIRDIANSDYQNTKKKKKIKDWGDECEIMCDNWELLRAERRTQFVGKTWFYL